MARTTTSAGPRKRHVQVCLGDNGQVVGDLTWVKDGNREYSTFAYGGEWLRHPSRFNVSPDLDLTAGYQARKARNAIDSRFFFTLSDTEPDAWGRRVIARAHAKERAHNPALDVLTEMDYLCAVDDYSRVGALRLRDDDGKFIQTSQMGARTTPPLVDLNQIYMATRAVETNTESIEDLRYLQGKGTSLGGMRPKSTLLDTDGSLAIGKFPSVGDERAVTRGEVLAMRLAVLAGIDAAPAHILDVDGVPVAVIKRFDRAPGTGRIHYMSASSLLQANRDDERTYTELVDAMRGACADFRADVRQLWRRLAFNLLITNTDDHLRNTGFLYAGNGLWHLSPAFDVNPFPDRLQESKTWLSEESGPIASVELLLGQAPRFLLTPDDALLTLGDITRAVSGWRKLAINPAIGMSRQDLRDFEPAFEHAQMEAALKLVAPKN